MTVRKATFGLCMICAMLGSAVAASGAAASSATAVTAGGITFTGITSMTAEDEGVTFYKWTTGGVTVMIEIAAVSGTAAGDNTETGGVMEAEAVGTLKYLEVGANHGCLVKGEKPGGGKPEVPTSLLYFHTLSTTELKFEPDSGSTIVEFPLSGCQIPALNKTWVISGSVIGTASGTRTTFVHSGTTSQGTLKANGSINAGLEGVLKLRGGNGNLLEFQ